MYFNCYTVIKITLHFTHSCNSVLDVFVTIIFKVIAIVEGAFEWKIRSLIFTAESFLVRGTRSAVPLYAYQYL